MERKSTAQELGSRQLRCSLRSVLFGMLIVATALSGALGNAFSIVLAALGLMLAGAAFYSPRANPWLSLTTGVGYVAAAAFVARLMQLK